VLEQFAPFFILLPFVINFQKFTGK